MLHSCLAYGGIKNIIWGPQEMAISMMRKLALCWGRKCETTNNFLLLSLSKQIKNSRVVSNINVIL